MFGNIPNFPSGNQILSKNGGPLGTPCWRQFSEEAILFGFYKHFGLKCNIFVISGSTFTPPDHARKKHRENTFEMGPRPELQSAASPFVQHPSGENAFFSTRALGKSTKLRVQKNPIKHGSKCSCSIFCNTSRVKMRFWEHSEFPGRDPKLE